MVVRYIAEQVQRFTSLDKRDSLDSTMGDGFTKRSLFESFTNLKRSSVDSDSKRSSVDSGQPQVVQDSVEFADEKVFIRIKREILDKGVSLDDLEEMEKAARSGDLSKIGPVTAAYINGYIEKENKDYERNNNGKTGIAAIRDAQSASSLFNFGEHTTFGLKSWGEQRSKGLFNAFFGSEKKVFVSAVPNYGNAYETTIGGQKKLGLGWDFKTSATGARKFRLSADPMLNGEEGKKHEEKLKRYALDMYYFVGSRKEVNHLVMKDLGGLILESLEGPVYTTLPNGNILTLMKAEGENEKYVTTRVGKGENKKEVGIRIAEEMGEPGSDNRILRTEFKLVEADKKGKVVNTKKIHHFVPTCFDDYVDYDEKKLGMMVLLTKMISEDGGIPTWINCKAGANRSQFAAALLVVFDAIREMYKQYLAESVLKDLSKEEVNAACASRIAKLAPEIADSAMRKVSEQTMTSQYSQFNNLVKSIGIIADRLEEMYAQKSVDVQKPDATQREQGQQQESKILHKRHPQHDKPLPATPGQNPESKVVMGDKDDVVNSPKKKTPPVVPPRRPTQPQSSDVEASSQERRSSRGPLPRTPQNASRSNLEACSEKVIGDKDNNNGNRGSGGAQRQAPVVPPRRSDRPSNHHRSPEDRSADRHSIRRRSPNHTAEVRNNGSTNRRNPENRVSVREMARRLQQEGVDQQPSQKGGNTHTL